MQLHTESVAAVTELAAAAHARGAAVEGELGNLPDAARGAVDHTAASLTDPEQAAAFVETTGIDCLAVSVGNVHLLAHGCATIDLDRLRAVHERVSVPLVIHGGSSFPPDAIAPAIVAGVAKFNVGTALRRAYLRGLSEALAQLPDEPDVHAAIGSHGPADVLEAGKAAVRETVQELIRQYGGSGRAA